jgi:hypothetical protein
MRQRTETFDVRQRHRVLTRKIKLAGSYRPGTLREKIFGSPRLPDRHPASRYRGAFAEPPAAAVTKAEPVAGE